MVTGFLERENAMIKNSFHNNQLNNKKFFNIWTILLFALMIRGALFVVSFDKGMYFPDEYEYMKLAKNLANGEGFSYNGHSTSFRPPGWPFLISLTFRLFHTNSPIPPRIMQILFGLITVFVMYRVGRDGWGEQVGLIAAAIFAVYPSLIGYSNLLLSEISFILIMSLACWAILRYYNNPNWIWSTAIGFILGLGALIRDSLLPIVFIVGFILIVYIIIIKRYRIKHVMICIFTLLITICPWIIRNSLLQGRFTMISTIGPMNLYLSNCEKTPMIHTSHVFIDYYNLKSDSYYYDMLFPELDGKSEAEKSNIAFRKGLEFIVAHPGQTIIRFFGRFVDFWGQERMIINQILNKYYGKMPVIVSLVFILFIFGGYSSVIISSIYGYFLTRLRDFDIVGLMFMGCYTITHVLVGAHPRYHMPLLPFLVIMSSRAIIARKDIWKRKKSRHFIYATTLSILFIMMWIVSIVLFDSDKTGRILR
jgi:4-amino-4-deoxy-L-arabinose transferase-like glycosyltransferase